MTKLARPVSRKPHPRGLLTRTLRERLRRAPRGRIFSAADFADLGERAAVDQALSRMVVSGELRRVARGLYDRPREHKLLGILMPTSTDIARAIAGRGKLKLQPSGAYAANLLGLSEQVPLKVVFLTDGVARTIRAGRQTIVMRRTTPRNMAAAGRVSGLVIQALRYMKQSNVDEAMMRGLRQRLSLRDKAILKADAHLAPGWIARIMLRLAVGEDEG